MPTDRPYIFLTCDSKHTYIFFGLTEELLEKIMLAKAKHKKLWKFYWNPFCCLGRVMDNATVSSLYCIALYDNYIALNDKVQKLRNFSKNC